MLGLFGSLNLGARSLQAEQQGIDVTGQNLANVNNPAYARQTVQLQTGAAVQAPGGLEGTGTDVVSIQQVRDLQLDSQITSETSVGGYWNANQTALDTAQSNLGQQVNSQSATGATAGTNGQQGIAGSLQDLFNAFQSLSTDPTSLSQRQVLVQTAQSLASQFNQVSQNLAGLNSSLNSTVQSSVSSANQLISAIAGLNNQITTTEAASGSTANDLRDLRQQKIESLANLVNIDTSNGPAGSVNIDIGGSAIVTGGKVDDTLQACDAGGGRQMVQTASGGTPLALTGGTIQGTIDARDGGLADLQNSLDSIASSLVTQVNLVHASGFSLTGSTNAQFFTGNSAGTIQVNSALVADPSLIQASGTAGATGDNSVALSLAQLANQPNSALNNQTFSGGYSTTVSALGQSLASANIQVSDQSAVQSMLTHQRDSVSGVSIDDEMTNLTKFQRAYQASAKLISTLDELLQTVITMKST